MRRVLQRSLITTIGFLLILPLQAAAQLTATPFVSGLSRPVGFFQDPSDPSVQVVIEQGGTVRVIKDGVLQATPFLTIDPGEINSQDERGLLGLAFAPDYVTSRRVYVSFTNAAGHSVVARFLRDQCDPLLAVPGSRFDLQWPDGQRFIEQPFANHNGGNIAFGPDGYLYFGLGDGGDGNDPGNRAQDPQTLLGKMLRINVAVPDSDTKGYTIPADNPFVGQAGVLGEIWAFGLRNPWRWSFDYPKAGSTGALIIGDVGQGRFEEIDYEPMGRGGQNYGWRNREGAHDNEDITPLPLFGAPLRDPIFEYPRIAGRSITGGFVYRGNALGSDYVGRYFFGDFVTSRIWSVKLNVEPFSGEATVSDLQEHTTALNGAAGSVSSFGVDAAGELYVVSHGGTVYRVSWAGPPPAGACATPDPFLAGGGGLCAGGVWYSRSAGSDFTSDLNPDLVFENTSGQLYAWFMDGRTMIGGSFLNPGQVDANRVVSASGDFSGDGKPDLLVQHGQTGAVSLFIMDGVNVTAEQTIPIAAGTPWRVVGADDFNGDTFQDILWMNPGSGELYIWFMRPAGGFAGYGGPGGEFLGGYVEDVAHARIVLGATPWRIAGSGDISGDGKGDLVWQNDTTGEIVTWYMDGVVATAGVNFLPSAVNSSWRIRAVADYNRDQHVDLVWQHVGTGDLYTWSMVGPRFAAGGFLTPSRVNLIWTVRSPK